jgi:probable HAF family extracellular repeat protein
MSSDPHARVVRPSLVGLLAVVILAACVADPGAPVAPGLTPAFGKTAGGGPAVSSTLPASGDQAQTLDVHVFGSGFAPGATAQWALRGAVDPSKVRTNSTTYVSSTELIANITIASDATIAYWDVQVMAGGKTGVGTEMFEVTTATAVLSGTGSSAAYGVNDQGDIVGGFVPSANTTHAFVVSGTDGAVSDLGWQKARAISADGLVAVGGMGTTSGSQFAGVWTRAPGAAWPSSGTRLPDPSGTTAANGLAYGIANVAAEGVTVVTGDAPNGIPVYWQSTDGTWSAPAQQLPLPAAYASAPASAEAIAATTGDIGGVLNDLSGSGLAGTSVPLVWRRVADGYVVDVLPLLSGYAGGYVRGISQSGTIMVGNVRQSSKGKDVIVPVFWTRDANNVYSVYALPTLSAGATGQARGVTVTGGQVRAVGTSTVANGSFVHAVLWTWTAGTLGPISVRDIGGLGKKSDVTPYAINPSGTIAVGGDGTAAIKWLLP